MRVKRYVYRGKPGWLVYGKRPEDAFKTSIFVTEESRARELQTALRASATDEEISSIILKGAGITRDE